MKIKSIAMVIATAAVSASFIPAVCSAAYPEKEAKIVVPYKPGGATDIIYRVTAANAEATFGKSIVVVNQNGAGGVKGARFVKESAADGYTLLAGHDFLFTTYYGGLSKFTYDAFEPVCLLTQTPNIITVRPDLPFKDFKGMIEYAKANPGKLSITYSPASTGMVFFSRVFKLAGVDPKLFRVVVINGTGPQVTNVLGGHVDVVMGNVPSVLEYAKAGQLRMLAVSSEKRLDACPEVPTFKELGIDFSYATNRGVFAPKGTPREVIDKVASAYEVSCRSDDTRTKVGNLGSEVRFMGPDQFGKFLKEQDQIYKATFGK